jgi:hypothetical protein
MAKEDAATTIAKYDAHQLDKIITFLTHAQHTNLNVDDVVQ